MNMDITARILLGAFFVFSGTIKVQQIGDALYPKLHKSMATEFRRYHRASFVRQLLPTMKATQYREAIGMIEIGCGLMMAAGIFTKLSTFVLIALMAVSIYTHVTLEDDFQVTIVPALILLSLMFILMTKKEDEEKKKVE